MLAELVGALLMVVVLAVLSRKPASRIVAHCLRGFGHDHTGRTICSHFRIA
jgi:hypothetical protein